MPEITLNSRLPDFLVPMDWRDSRSDPEGFYRTLVDHFEGGDVIILQHHPLSLDYEVLNRVSFPKGRRYQKLSDRFLLYPKLYRSEVAATMREAFAGDPLLYFRVRREVARIHSKFNRFVRSLFPGYRFLDQKQNISWRFTPTGPEGMHLDHFGSGEDYQYVRLFLNVDREPRVWRVGQRLDDLAERYYESGDLGRLRNDGGNEFCRAMNGLAFGSKQFDYHEVRFHQGDMWLADSRIVSHQIFRGNRLLATHMAADPQSMRDPSRRLECRVEGYHQRLGGFTAKAQSAPCAA